MAAYKAEWNRIVSDTKSGLWREEFGINTLLKKYCLLVKKYYIREFWAVSLSSQSHSVRYSFLDLARNLRATDQQNISEQEKKLLLNLLMTPPAIFQVV